MIIARQTTETYAKADEFRAMSAPNAIRDGYGAPLKEKEAFKDSVINVFNPPPANFIFDIALAPFDD